MEADRAAIPPELREKRPGSLKVTLEPAGTMYSSSPPDRIVAHRGVEAEIAIALEQKTKLVAMFDRSYLVDMNRLFFQQIPGVDLNLSSVQNLPSGQHISKERFYSINADLHMMDPRIPVAWGWSPSDLGEVASRTGPFFGNFIRRKERWGPDYRIYTLDELFSTYAKLFQKRERFRRIARFRDQLIDRIQNQLPGPEQIPSALFLLAQSNPSQGKFKLNDLRSASNRGRQYRRLGLKQVDLPEERSAEQFAVVGYETLLSIDPEIIIVDWAVNAFRHEEQFEEQFVTPLSQHPLGKKLQAVQNNNVLPGGNGDQGPITHLFQLEMIAKQIFPDRFGTWTWGEVPDRPLFSRKRLSDVLTQ